MRALPTASLRSLLIGRRASFPKCDISGGGPESLGTAIAANRGLKVNGPYRLVRHPIYFAHFLTLGGFVVANMSALNVGLAAAVLVCQLLRMSAEERVLESSAEYATYRRQVRWRLIPGVY